MNVQKITSVSEIYISPLGSNTLNELNFSKMKNIGTNMHDVKTFLRMSELTISKVNEIKV